MTDYVLPITCKQADIILKILGYFFLISSPISIIVSLFYGVNLNDETPNQIDLLFTYGFLGTIVSWFVKIVTFFEGKKLPSFKCKPDKK